MDFGFGKRLGNSVGRNLFRLLLLDSLGHGPWGQETPLDLFGLCFPQELHTQPAQGYQETDDPCEKSEHRDEFFRVHRKLPREKKVPRFLFNVRHLKVPGNKPKLDSARLFPENKGFPEKVYNPHHTTKSAMDLPPNAHIHLIAICGTAMGSLAGMLRERGYQVTGSDAHVYPPMSTFLREIGVPVQEGFAPEHLGNPDLVVVGNAVSRGNPEVEAVLSRRLPYLSLPEVLRDFFIRGRRPVVVTGTHGKTTTTALLAHLLTCADLDPSFLVAGIPRNFPGSYHLGKGDFFVLEGDEYDSAFFFKIAKFFFYLPEILIVNNLEFDHADIYADLEEIKKAFRQLINLVPQNGLLLANSEDPVLAELVPDAFAPTQTFGLEQPSTWRAAEIQVTPQGTRFSLDHQTERLARFDLPLGGHYNVRNALAAIAVGLHAGLSLEQLQEGLRTFKGVKRRQEVVGQAGGITLIDDFAHHPTAVEQTLMGLRQTYPGARFWIIFEPASATNARAIFEARYVQAFALADHLIIAGVPRPERARSDPPFDPERLAATIRKLDRSALFLPATTAIVEHVTTRLQPGDVVVFMSNSGFGDIQHQFLDILKNRFGEMNGNAG